MSQVSTSTGAAVDEPTFTKAFLSLLHTTATKNLPDDHVCSRSLPAKPLVLLPEMPQAKRKTMGDSIKGNAVPKIDVTLKSIRGVKFTCKISADASDNVYTVKEKLIEAESGSNLKGYKPANVRLLVKGKVQQDSKQLSEILQDGSDGEQAVSFTVMLSAPTTADEEPEPAVEPESVVPANFKLSADDWKAVHEVLVKRLGEPNASFALKKMQNSGGI